MNDATKAFVGHMADDLVEHWDTFGAPDSVSMALMDIHSAALGTVCDWTPDVVEVYAGEDEGWKRKRDEDPVRFGAYLVDWLAGLVTHRMADVIDLLADVQESDDD